MNKLGKKVVFKRSNGQLQVGTIHEIFGENILTVKWREGFFSYKYKRVQTHEIVEHSSDHRNQCTPVPIIKFIFFVSILIFMVEIAFNYQKVLLNLIIFCKK